MLTMEDASVTMIFTSLAILGTSSNPLQYSLLQDFSLSLCCNRCVTVWDCVSFYAFAVVLLMPGMWWKVIELLVSSILRQCCGLVFWGQNVHAEFFMFLHEHFYPCRWDHRLSQNVRLQPSIDTAPLPQTAETSVGGLLISHNHLFFELIKWPYSFRSQPAHFSSITHTPQWVSNSDRTIPVIRWQNDL